MCASRSGVIAIVTCVLALACGLARSSADGDEHQLELKRHYDHLAYIADFPCHLPQPRVIPANHLFTDTHGKAYFPDVTVLHRCDLAAGCCTSEKHCAPEHTETLHLPFKVTFLDDQDGHKKGSWIMKSVELVNHTACECVEPPPPQPPHVDQPFCAHLQESCGALSDSCSALQTSCRAYVLDQHHDHDHEHESHHHGSISEDHLLESTKGSHEDDHHSSEDSHHVKGSSKKKIHS